MKDSKIEKLVMTALMTALITVVTIVIPIPVPFTNGYIHLGDSMIFLAVIILGWKAGTVAAAFGSAIADLLLGFAYWAPWTLVIKGGMALILGFVLYQSTRSKIRFAVTSAIIIAFWLIFNYIVQSIINFEHQKDVDALIEGSGVAGAAEFGDFLARIESWLMIGSFALPLILIVIGILFIRFGKMSMPLAQMVAMAGSGIFMVFGYYIAGGLIYGNFAIAAFSVPFNILQFVVGFVLATLVSTGLAKTPFKSKMFYFSSSRESDLEHTMEGIKNNRKK